MYTDCRGIIDASEIKAQGPSSLVLNSEMHPSYQSHTTYKGNVIISPSGEIIHNSSLFEGSISDKASNSSPKVNSRIANKFITFEFMSKGPLGGSRNLISLIGSSQ